MLMLAKLHIMRTLENMVREWGERNAQANNLPAGSVAEVFKIVNTN
jgi:hypothetical protein